MSTKVQTVSKCEFCGATHIRECAEQFYPPYFWYEVRIAQRLKSYGWPKRKTVTYEVCTECGELLLNHIKKETQNG